MTGKQAIRAALEASAYYLNWYVADLTDADLLVRPTPQANHVAWQLGNVIGGDIFLVRAELPDAAFPDLPAGFMDRHGTATAADPGADGYLTKAEYLSLFAAVRAATVAALDALPDDALDRPSSDAMTGYAATLGHLFLLVSNHTLLHVGQFTPIRRALGKPVLW